MYIILLFSLIFATYTDIKSRTIPVWLFPGTVLFGILWQVANGNHLSLDNLVGFLCMGIPIFLFSAFGKIGGADVLMFSAIGLLLGSGIISFLLFLTLINTIFLIIVGFKKKECPIAPFALGAYVLFLIFCT